MQEEQREIVEPLAKFHVKVHSQYRITFPRETREAFRIIEGDYVVLIIRKIEGYPPCPTKRALVVLKISTNGVMVLPIELVRNFEISKGEVLEVVFLKHIHPPRILIPEIPKTVTTEITKKGFLILNEAQEREILNAYRINNFVK